MAAQKLNIDELLEQIGLLTILEAADLAKKMEDTFGISPAAPMMAMAPGMMPGAGPAEEEKTEFDVILEAVGGNKIAVIKEVRALTSLGLKDAKDLVEAGGKAVKEGIPKEEAEKIKKKLEGAGATVKLA